MSDEDIAMYTHDVGKACMYPDYPCEICEARKKIKKSQDYVVGYNKALYDMRKYLSATYKTDLDLEIINQIIQELKNT